MGRSWVLGQAVPLALEIGDPRGHNLSTHPMAPSAVVALRRSIPRTTAASVLAK
jgi:hypothetical protein